MCITDITRRRLKEYAKRHPKATVSLNAWHAVANSARWRSIAEVKQSFPHADAAQVASGKIPPNMELDFKETKRLSPF